MCGESTYLAPKPASCGVVVDERGRVLIGRRAGDPHAGLWDVLGGFLEPGESPEDGLRRELREEIGVECSVGSYLGGFVDSYGDDGDATLNLAFECRIESGEPHPADDVSRARLVRACGAAGRGGVRVQEQRRDPRRLAPRRLRIRATAAAPHA